jgi:hypothetical protein
MSLPQNKLQIMLLSLITLPLIYSSFTSTALNYSQIDILATKQPADSVLESH